MPCSPYFCQFMTLFNNDRLPGIQMIELSCIIAQELHRFAVEYLILQMPILARVLSGAIKRREILPKRIA